eukprot:jgi/Psemu1/11979/gm1.11979_g
MVRSCCELLPNDVKLSELLPISYFECWWKEQAEEWQKEVRVLLDNKQFEFVMGGWVQPDEANTQLYAIGIQLPTMAYLLKEYNFKAMLIQRVHYAIKKELTLHKNLEFMWRHTWDKTQYPRSSKQQEQQCGHRSRAQQNPFVVDKKFSPGPYHQVTDNLPSTYRQLTNNLPTSY